MLALSGWLEGTNKKTLTVTRKNAATGITYDARLRGSRKDAPIAIAIYATPRDIAYAPRSSFLEEIFTLLLSKRYAPTSMRGNWIMRTKLKLYLRHRFLAFVHIEEFRFYESEHACNQIRREWIDFDVEITHVAVIKSARCLNFVFRIGKLAL